MRKEGGNKKFEISEEAGNADLNQMHRICQYIDQFTKKEKNADVYMARCEMTTRRKAF